MIPFAELLNKFFYFFLRRVNFSGIGKFFQNKIYKKEQRSNCAFILLCGYKSVNLLFQGFYRRRNAKIISTPAFVFLNRLQESNLLENQRFWRREQKDHIMMRAV